MNIHKQVHRFRNFYRVVLRDPQRKNFFRIFLEYTRFWLSDPAGSEQYFSKYLYRKGVHNLDHYLLTEKLQYKSWKLNDFNYVTILDNKHLFELFFSKFNLSIVRSLAYNCNSLFFKDNDFFQIHSSDEFRDFLMHLISERSRSKSIFIKKKEGSCGGLGIFRIRMEDLENDPGKIRQVYGEVIQSDFLFQDTVIQHEELNRLNPHCINTIRIDTYTNLEGSSKVLSSFIRIGINRSFVDNVSSGGVFVGINPDTGILNPVVFSDFTHGRGKTFQEHPDTGYRFEGFQIPFFQEAKELAIKATQLVPQIRIIGWDIAIQPEGPIIIEGNHHPGLSFSEIGQGGFLNNPVFMELYQELTR